MTKRQRTDKAIWQEGYNRGFRDGELIPKAVAEDAILSLSAAQRLLEGIGHAKLGHGRTAARLSKLWGRSVTTEEAQAWVEKERP